MEDQARDCFISSPRTTGELVVVAGVLRRRFPPLGLVWQDPPRHDNPC
jgi:cysteine synthase